MRAFATLTAAGILAAGLLRPAHAVDVLQTMDTSAAPAAVWGVISAFDGIATWLPGAVSSPADRGNAVGSVRIITLKAAGNPTITEKLTAYAEKKRSYSYAITAVDPKVLPVTGYTSTIVVKATKTGSKVVWSGTFEPAAGTNENADAKAVAGVYRGGLDNIKKLTEK